MTTTTGSLSLRPHSVPKFYCLIRQQLVAATPEEQVRQQLLRWMIEKAGYPANQLIVEISLKRLFPHGMRLPRRRPDILCVTTREGALQPLLLIECKSVPLTAPMERQLIGYNRFVKASFVTLANGHQLRTGYCQENGEYLFSEGIPLYTEMNSKTNF